MRNNITPPRMPASGTWPLCVFCGHEITPHQDWRFVGADRAHRACRQDEMRYGLTDAGRALVAALAIAVLSACGGSSIVPTPAATSCFAGIKYDPAFPGTCAHPNVVDALVRHTLPEAVRH